MLIVLDAHATDSEREAVNQAVRSLGFDPRPMEGPSRTAICVIGNDGRVDGDGIALLPGVREIIHVSKPYKLVSREVHPADSVFHVGEVEIGGQTPVMIAGPCSVETEARTLEVARAVREAGAQMFRAGAYKPRTSPYAFQGLGAEGLRTLARVREETGMPVVTEVLDAETAEDAAEHVDVLQVGARNMQNFTLLKKLGRIDRPVLLKRGLSASLQEWLLAAEYLVSLGNSRVVLCERGIRTFSDHSRNTLDLNVVPLVRELSHLPVIVDPSHGVGHRGRVRAMSRAALAAGAQGLMLETHVEPDTAYTDRAQTIDVETFAGVRQDAEVLAKMEELLPSSQ